MADPCTRLDLGELASRAATSVRTVSRLFPADTGLTFKAWRQRERIVHTMDMLARGETIARVSTGCGFASTAAFSSAFRRVTAMASGRNEEYVRSLGADVFIDYTVQAFEHVASDMDVVFDTVGVDTFQRSFQTLRKGGFLVTSVAFPADEAQRYGVGVGRVQCKPDAGELALMRELVEGGKLTAYVSKVLPLADIREALALSERGHTRGKIVLRIAP